MQNAKQVYCKALSDDHVQVVENNTQHGDCQIVLMEERLTEEDQVELESEYQQNNDEEIAEKYQYPDFPVSTCIWCDREAFVLSNRLVVVEPVMWVWL